MTEIALLPERGVLEVTGPDRVPFLQGLVSNDVAEAAPGRAVWAALLTPQGKWLADFFILADGERLLLDCEQAQLPGLLQRLSRFRLRSQVQLRDVSADLRVHAAWALGSAAPDLLVPNLAAADLAATVATAGAVSAPDPRLLEAGWRVLSAAPIPSGATEIDYDRHRLALGLPDGSRDLEAEKTVLLEAGFDELHGVSWTKGCYMGQELTARTKYRGLVKRRLVPVDVAGPLPEPGTSVMRDGAEVGTIRSGRDGSALGVLRVDALDAALVCGEARLTPRVPAWMVLPAAVPA